MSSNATGPTTYKYGHASQCVRTSADQGLDHVGPVIPHGSDKLKHIEVLLHLHPLQHGIQTDVRARATDTSTGGRGGVRENEGAREEAIETDWPLLAGSYIVGITH